MISSTYTSLAVARELEGLDASAEARTAHARAKNTHTAYQGDFERFRAWCEEKSLPTERATPRAVRAYLEFLARDGLSVSSIQRAYAGIAFYLRKLNPEAWPRKTRPVELRDFFAGMRRQAVDDGRAPRRKAALTGADLAEALSAMSFRSPLIAARDRAILVIGFVGAFRRSEIVQLRLEHVTLKEEGMTILLAKSKTDQTGEGILKAFPYDDDASICPVRTLAAWLKAARAAGTPIERGFLFGPVVDGRVAFKLDADGKQKPMSDRYVARLVKRAARAIGLDEDDFAGHSLRAGFVTTAAENGADYGAIMDQTGHVRIEQVREYVRRVNVLKNTAARGLIARDRDRSRE